MLILHVHDFLIAGTSKFVEETTALTISKIEDSVFRFCGVDLCLKDGMIEVSMEDYTESLEECPVLPERKKKEEAC